MLVKSRIKYIQSLGQKKFRDEGGLFIAEGPKIVEEFLKSVPAQIDAIYALPEWIKSRTAPFNSVEVLEITSIELEKISQLSTPNQVVAVVRQFKNPPIVSSKGMITLVLDDIQDPGNFGTIIRIADWFGISQIVCSLHSAELYNPKVVQASMGSISRVRVYYTELADWLKQQEDATIYATVLDGKDIRQLNPILEGIIVIGNESKGIHPSLLSYANEKITITRKGEASSLNAAVATGIILSHIS